MQDKPNPSPVEWAWLAGLFEGEGYFAFHDRRVVQAAIKMTDRDVLETVDRLVPSPRGLKVSAPRMAHHKPQYAWTLSSRDDVIAFIEGVKPWLHSRRLARAEEALEALSKNRGIHSHKEHCRNGHVWAEAGIYVAPNGKRHCRECIRESNMRYRAKHRERYLSQHAKHERDRRRRKSIEREAQRGSEITKG